jgi:endoglucanase
VYSKLEYCTFHVDVIDAMFRQVHSAAAIPYGNNEIKNNTVIQAVNYDLGRNGSAYYDRDTANYHGSGAPGQGNRGHTYRNDGVDIRKDSLHYEQYFVSDIEDGEWLQYTIHSSTPASYTLRLHFGAIEKKGTISVMLNGKMIAQNVYLPATGGMKEWKTIDINGIRLTGKQDRLRIKATHGGFNMKQLEFKRTAS